MKLAMATGRPESVVGIHFFNPVPVLRLVELVASLLTSEATAERARSFAAGQLGKTVIHSRDRAGFVVNALLIPYLLSAIRMLESGFATAEDIDSGMVEGCAHPMGPLALADLIGLDTTQAVASLCTKSSKSRSTLHHRCYPGWSRRACSGGRRGRASSAIRRSAPGRDLPTDGDGRSPEWAVPDPATPRNGRGQSRFPTPCLHLPVRLPWSLPCPNQTLSASDRWVVCIHP